MRVQHERFPTRARPATRDCRLEIMDQIALMVLPLVLVLSLGLYMLRWQYRTAEARLRTWAERSELTLIEQHKANPPGTGPMARSTSNKQVMYRVIVALPSGERRSAVVRIGSAAMGVLSADLAVEWLDGPA